jgi:serine/threonine protein kinase
MAAFDPPDFSGFLRKRGGNIKLYRRRWFELRGKYLYYFKAQKHNRPRGVIALLNTKIQNGTKKHQFTISGKYLSRTYEITAENETDFKEWTQELSRAASAKEDERDVKEFKTMERDIKRDTVRAQSLYALKTVTLQDFDLLKVIGRGSFAKVMKVKKKDTGEIFAMKILKKEQVIDQEAIKQTNTENQILQHLHHPFIVQLHYAFQTLEKLYLVMEYLPGGELFFHLKELETFNVEKARFYAAEIALAFEYLHGKGIIYRDLKPENVVLDRQGNVKLTDFGLAKNDSQENSPAYTFAGAPEYLAPEILKGKGHAKSVDWWTLGILLYEMLVGVPPFFSENINETYEAILKKDVCYPKEVTPDAKDLIEGLLTKNPDDRLNIAGVRRHPFFSEIDWEKLLAKQITAPFVPQFEEDDDDTKYFDTEFTREKPADSFAIVPKSGADSFDSYDFFGTPNSTTSTTSTPNK